MSYIEVTKVSKTFDEYRAVDGVSFRVKAGEIFGFLGPNGAGKTTTIRMIMNITRPDSGTINFSGTEMNEGLKKKIGYLPEERGLYPKMKVGPMLKFLGMLKGMSSENADEAVNSWLKRLEIESWEGKKIEELSKGMQQKIQFIATIMHDPEMVILDEPFSGLDPVNVDVLRDIILELKEKNKIVFFSTHMMEKAEQLCDEIFLINNGKGVLSGPLAEIKSRFSENEYFAELEGDAGFVKDLPYVKNARLNGKELTAKLEKPKDKDKLLKELVERTSVIRFMPKEKSLHDIFVSQVGGTNHA
jgi:ABC-2 type transport system ATP-binding protein